MTYIEGVDTSRWEDDPATTKTIDWQHMATHNIQFAIMRASGSSAGGHYTDAVYQLHSKNAKGVMLRGSYHFFSPSWNPVDQARYYWNLIKDNDEELPPCIDIEGYPYGDLPKGDPLLKQIKLFLDELEKLSGKVPMIYCNQDIIRNYLQVRGKAGHWITRYPLWISWLNANPPTSNDISPWSQTAIWQYSYKGPAVDLGATEAKEMDMNRFLDLELFSKICTPVQVEKPSEQVVLPVVPVNTGVTMTNQYSGNAKIIMVHEQHAQCDFSKVPFVDGVDILAFDRDTINPLFTKQLQWAYDAKKVIFAHVIPNILDYPGIGSGGVDDWDDFSHWPPVEKDVNFVKMTKLFMSGGVKRGIDCVVIDMRVVRGDNGTIVPASWVAKAGRYLAKFVWETYKIPWVIMTGDAKTGEGFETLYSNSAEINRWLSEPLFDKNGKAIPNTSAIDASLQWKVVNPIGTVPSVDISGEFPVPTCTPMEHLWQSWTWFLWWFGSAKIPGITDVNGVTKFVPVMIANLPKAKFYEKFGKKAAVPPVVEPPVVVPPVVVPPVDVPPVIVDETSSLENAKAVVSLFDLIIGQLNQLRTLVMKALGM